MHCGLTERILARDHAGVRAVPDQSVLELAASVEHPTFQAAICESQIARIESLGFAERRVFIRISPEYPVTVKPQNCDDQYQEETPKPAKPAVCFGGTKIL